MPDHIFEWPEGPGVERFEYRILYLRPNQHSDERLSVGLIATKKDGLELALVSSPPALDALTRLIGEPGTEQFHFASAELRRRTTVADSWDQLVMPTDLLDLGQTFRASTCDRRGFLTSVLQSSSVLHKGVSPRANEVIGTVPAGRVSSELYHHISLLNPLKADELFHQKVSLPSNGSTEEIELPILGQRVFGAPVSYLLAKADQKMRAEAYIAKLNWLRKYLEPRPAVYVLAPSDETGSIAQKAVAGVRELREVAHAARVDLTVSQSISEMAKRVIDDEAA